MCFYFHTDSEIVKLVIQMRRLMVRNIKKFVQGHSVDLAPELWTLGSQNQISYITPLGICIQGVTTVAKCRCLAFKPGALYQVVPLLQAFFACCSHPHWL